MATLIEVSALYRQAAPVPDILAALERAFASPSPPTPAALPAWLEYGAQERFVDEVIMSPQAAARPPPAKLTVTLLKAYVARCEACGVEDLCDGIFELLARLAPRALESHGNLSYDVPMLMIPGNGDADASADNHRLRPAPHVTLALKVEPVHNEVGLRMWEAGFLLTEYVCGVGRGLVRGRTVLELGAGLGLTGMAAAACAGAGRVVLTDSQPAVLGNLEAQLAANGLASRPPSYNSYGDDDLGGDGGGGVFVVGGGGGGGGGGVGGGGGDGNSNGGLAHGCSIGVHGGGSCSVCEVAALDWCAEDLHAEIKAALQPAAAAAVKAGADPIAADLEAAATATGCLGSGFSSGLRSNISGGLSGSGGLVVLAADVLYDPTIVPHFVNVVDALLRGPATTAAAAAAATTAGATATAAASSSGGDNGGEDEANGDRAGEADGEPVAGEAAPLCLVAATLRNPSTLALFFDELARRGISCAERTRAQRSGRGGRGGQGGAAPPDDAGAATVSGSSAHIGPSPSPQPAHHDLWPRSTEMGAPFHPFFYDDSRVRLFALGRCPTVNEEEATELSGDFSGGSSGATRSKARSGPAAAWGTMDLAAAATAARALLSIEANWGMPLRF